MEEHRPALTDGAGEHAPRAAGELVGPQPVSPTDPNLAARVAALEWRQAMLLQRLAGDARIAHRLDPGGDLEADWKASLAWAAQHYPLPAPTNGNGG